MTEDLFALIVIKYAQLNKILDDFTRACGMPESDEKNLLIDSIKERTNHTGIHFTPIELVSIFMGSTPLK